MILKNYVRKNVEIVYLDGDKIKGFVSSFDEKDIEDGIMFDSITIEGSGIAEYLAIFEDEIRSIEIVDK